jgi:hypothetical protein
MSYVLAKLVLPKFMLHPEGAGDDDDDVGIISETLPSAGQAGCQFSVGYTFAWDPHLSII